MKDFLGNELNTGNVVVWAYRKSTGNAIYRVGTIAGFKKQKNGDFVIIDSIHYPRRVKKINYKVIKVS